MAMEQSLSQFEVMNMHERFRDSSGFNAGVKALKCLSVEAVGQIAPHEHREKGLRTVNDAYIPRDRYHFA
jgi:hypothetical protein